MAKPTIPSDLVDSLAASATKLRGLADSKARAYGYDDDSDVRSPEADALAALAEGTHRLALILSGRPD